VLRNLIESNYFDEGEVFVLFSLQKTFVIGSDEKQLVKIATSCLNPSNDKVKLNIVTALPTRLNNIFVYLNTRKIHLLSSIFDYRNLMFWFPVLCRLLRNKIEKYNADEVVISSFAAVKNACPSKRPVSWDEEKDKSQVDKKKKSPKTRPVSRLYLHSPMQYIRENYEENVKKLSFPIKQLYKFAAIYLRPRDRKSRHYDVVLCNSNYTANLAKQLY
jgi:hypothetical protein